MSVTRGRPVVPAALITVSAASTNVRTIAYSAPRLTNVRRALQSSELRQLAAKRLTG
ncbi:hypothetical protein AB0L97_12150 [Nocardia sp. NPDC051911]|uniref:hypothetical protein n=1 Tax=Nocardia sp. NPDC051911 TaxID=3154648 RepID=UPI0034173722